MRTGIELEQDFPQWAQPVERPRQSIPATPKNAEPNGHAVERALCDLGRPEIFDTDRGSQS